MRWTKYDRTQWSRWFAWRPVVLYTGKTVVWLEVVERQWRGSLFESVWAYRGREIRADDPNQT